MKKHNMLFLLLICLTFNISNVSSAFAVNVFKEGVYKLSDFNFSKNNIYNIQNTSANSGVFVAIFDENQVVLQALKLEPQSTIFNIPPLKPNYRIAVIGNGEVTISEKTS